VNNLILNSFPVEISPNVISLPVLEFDSWEQSTQSRNRDLQDFTVWRFKRPVEPGTPERIRMVVIDGPNAPSEIPVAQLDVTGVPRLGAVLVELSIAKYLANTGMTVERSSFETLALRRETNIQDPFVQVFTGVSFQARLPFRDNPGQFSVSFQWEVRAYFSQPVTSPALRRIAAGMSVLYQPTGVVPEELREFRGKYLGRLLEVGNDGSVLVRCRDHADRRVGAADIRLEASPSALNRYERQEGRKGSSSLFRRIQQLSLVLTREGRRNISVLRDRMDAIRAVLGTSSGSSKGELVVPFASFHRGFVIVGLTPQQVELQSSW